MAEDKKDDKKKTTAKKPAAKKKAPAKKAPVKKRESKAAKAPAKKKAAPKKETAKKAPAKKAAANKTPAKTKKEDKALPQSDTIKQTQDEIAESMKSGANKASTRSTEAAKQSKKAKARSVKKIPAGKALRVTQTGSPIGRQGYQRKILIGLGLNKMHRTRELEDTPAVRGMIEKVRHLVKVEDAA